MSELKLGAEAAVARDATMTPELNTPRTRREPHRPIASLTAFDDESELAMIRMRLKSNLCESIQWLNMNSSLVNRAQDMSISAARRGSSTPGIFCCSAEARAPTSAERSESVGWRLKEAR